MAFPPVLASISADGDDLRSEHIPATNDCCDVARNTIFRDIRLQPVPYAVQFDTFLSKQHTVLSKCGRDVALRSFGGDKLPTHNEHFCVLDDVTGRPCFAASKVIPLRSRIPLYLVSVVLGQILDRVTDIHWKEGSVRMCRSPRAVLLGLIPP